jgi:hypothetical protein
MHEKHDKTLKLLTVGAILLWPIGNIHGTHLFLNLNMGRVIAQNRWKVIPMPVEVIDHVNKLGGNITLDPMTVPDNMDQEQEEDENDGIHTTVEMPLEADVTLVDKCERNTSRKLENCWWKKDELNASQQQDDNDSDHKGNILIFKELIRLNQKRRSIRHDEFAKSRRIWHWINGRGQEIANKIYTQEKCVKTHIKCNIPMYTTV